MGMSGVDNENDDCCEDVCTDSGYKLLKIPGLTESEFVDDGLTDLVFNSLDPID